MARKLFKRMMPDREVIQRHRSLQMLGERLHDGNLWHLNRYSVSTAFFIGIFWAFVPMPMQMLPAALCALWWRANLPISMALVWLTNPITMPPIYYATYKFGSWLMGRPHIELHFEPTLAWLASEIERIWQPFLLGSLVTGVVLGLTAMVVIRVLWRVQVTLRWRARAKREGGREPRI
jgi:uncharacterized protein (DUF2062 family)